MSKANSKAWMSAKGLMHGTGVNCEDSGHVGEMWTRSVDEGGASTFPKEGRGIVKYRRRGRGVVEEEEVAGALLVLCVIINMSSTPTPGHGQGAL